MANFSDDEDLGPLMVAEARGEDWSDAEESDDDESPKIVARGPTHTIWSDDDETAKPEPDHEPEPEPAELAVRAGALFGGGGSDPIGDLRVKAKKMSRAAADSFDKYVRGASAEAKKLREARRKISALQAQGQKKLASVEKDKKLDESAKQAQRDQFKTFVADVAEITSKLAENEKWLNAILGQSAASTASAKAPSAARETRSKAPTEWSPQSEKVELGAGGTSTRKTAARNLVIHVPAGAEMSWIRDGKTGTHRAAPGGQHFKVKAGARYELANRGKAPATFTSIY